MDRRRPFFAVAAYVSAVAVFVYVIADRQVGYGSDAANAAILVSLALLHFCAGLAVGRWWAVLLPLLAILIAVPAGYPDPGRGEPLPIWLGLAVVVAPVGAALAGAGVAAARIVGRGRPTTA